MQGRIKFFNENCLPLKLLVPFLFCFSLIGYAKAQPFTLEGTGSAIDGDTIIINNYKIRLEGYVGTCWLGAVDIGALLIMQGVASDCVRYSRGRYRALETLSAQHLPLPKYCLKRSKKAKTN